MTLLDGSGAFTAPALLEHVVLHKHQERALQWLASLWDHGCGGVLADQMGLGKTLVCPRLWSWH